MTTKDLFKLFINEIYITPPRKNYPTKKIISNHIDQIWSIDLADMIVYKISNNKEFRYIFVLIDSFSTILVAVPLKIKNSKTLTQEFSKNRTLQNDHHSKWKVIEELNFIIVFFRTI